MATLLSYALTSVADVKESLGLPSSDHSKDNLITRKINQVTLQIEAYCERHFLLTTYTDEAYNSTSSNQLILKNRPIVGDVALGVRDTSLNSDDFETVESTLVFADNEAGILNLNFRAIGGWSGYRVTYEAGYATIPADLAEAAASLAAYYVTYPSGNTAFVQQMSEGQRAIRFGQTAKSFATLLQELGVDDIINSYANYPVLTSP